EFDVGVAEGEGEAQPHIPIDIAVVAAAARGFTLRPAGSRKARVSSDVRMRARGSNKAAVLGVIPRGSEVSVIACRGWCEISFAGKRGWISGDFVDGVRKPARKNSAKTSASGADKTKTAANSETAGSRTLMEIFFGRKGAGKSSKE